MREKTYKVVRIPRDNPPLKDEQALRSHRGSDALGSGFARWREEREARIAEMAEKLHTKKQRLFEETPNSGV